MTGIYPKFNHITKQIKFYEVNVIFSNFLVRLGDVIFGCRVYIVEWISFASASWEVKENSSKVIE